MATVEKLLTAEEFHRLPNDGRPTELVRGRIEEMAPTGVRHGRICVKIGFFLELYLVSRDLGIAVSNDSGVVTERNPDSVRGPDVAYYSYDRLPRGTLPTGYASVPEIVFEVLSRSDRRSNALAKRAEFLQAGVLAACLVDPERRSVTVFSANEPEQMLAGDQELTFPQILPVYAVPVSRFFQ